MTRNDRDAPRDMARTMGFAALLLAVSALLSRVLGFAREIVISTVHGATAATDAYHAAFTLPELMNYFLAGGTLSITFIPLFSSYITRGDEAGGWRLFSIVATTMGGVLLVFTVLAEVFAPHLVPLVAPGFEDPELVELTVSMTRIVLPAQLMFYVGGLINATLFARKIFWPAALAPLLYNACIIAGGLVLAPWWGIQGFSVGVVLGAFFGQVVVPVYAVRETIRYRPIIAWRDPGFVKYLWLTLPLMLGATLLTVDEWLLRVLGSMHERGAITWLNQGRKLMMVLFAVIGQAAGQAALPFLTQKFHEGKGEELGAVLTESLQRVLFLASGASLWLMTIAEPLVFTVFHHGAFTTDDAAMTSDLLVAFSFGLTAWAAQSLLVRGFYARQDTLTPMVLGTLGLALSLPIYVVL
ncbi:MAG: murein biosynthesis integral membrane protein MurJ, partial [Myxococcota bacterium]